MRAYQSKISYLSELCHCFQPMPQTSTPSRSQVPLRPPLTPSSYSRAPAQDIRRQTAEDLKANNAAASVRQIGRSSVQFHVNNQSSSSVGGFYPPPPPPSIASTSSSSQHVSLDRLSLHAPLTPNLSTASLSQHAVDGGVVEPLDYEEFVTHQTRMGDRDPCGHMLEFPRDDIDVKVVPRKIRTMGHVLPEEAKYVVAFIMIEDGCPGPVV
jgi:hypothetical protein